FTQELGVPFARPSLFCDCPSNCLNSCVKLDQMCGRHFQGLMAPQHFAQLVDCTAKVTRMLVTNRRFVLANLGQGIPQHLPSSVCPMSEGRTPLLPGNARYRNAAAKG